MKKYTYPNMTIAFFDKENVVTTPSTGTMNAVDNWAEGLWDAGERTYTQAVEFGQIEKIVF